MTKEQRKVPEVRFKGFFEDWEQRKLGEVSYLSSSKRIHAKDYRKSGIPFYRGSEISLGGITGATELFIDSILYEEIKNKYGVPAINDILITAVGTIGNIWKVDNRKFYYKDGNLIQISNIKVCNDYLFVYLANGKGKKRILESSAGSNQKALTMVKLREIPLFYPRAIHEQTKIGNFFSKLDNCITLQQQKIEKLKLLKKGYLEKLFPKNAEKIPEIRFSGFDEVWVEKKLKDFGKSTGGTSIESEFVERGEYKVISIGSYSENNTYFDQGLRVNKSNKTEDRILSKNDLTMILNDKTSSGNIIGRVLLIPNSDKYVYNQRTQRIEVNKEKYLPKFLYHLLNYDYMRFKIIKSAQGNTQIYVNWSSISELTYSVPKSFSEQAKIGSFFSNLDFQISNQEAKLEKLKLLKEEYLRKMFI